jgi:glycosyltransferase involved in cell wall biosynthesis
MLVSVVIPVYNEQRYLQRCIDSLLQQTYKNFEVIFVDDGSKDKTHEILKKAAKNKKIKFFLRNHGGPGAARNFGAKKAKGDILVFVDGDMVFDKKYIEILTKPIREKKTHGTFHTKELVANAENIWARAWCLNRMPEGVTESGVYRAVLKKEFFRAGGFDPSQGYFDDNLAVLGSATPAHAICYHNNPETLGEAFKHSMWVGRSLLKNPVLKGKMYTFVTLSFLALILSVVCVFFGIWWPMVTLVALAVVVWLAISIARTIPRFKEKHPEYILTIPILWFFRLSGYYLGALQKFFGLRK